MVVSQTIALLTGPLGRANMVGITDRGMERDGDKIARTCDEQDYKTNRCAPLNLRFTDETCRILSDLRRAASLTGNIGTETEGRPGHQKGRLTCRPGHDIDARRGA